MTTNVFICTEPPASPSHLKSILTLALVELITRLNSSNCQCVIFSGTISGKRDCGLLDGKLYHYPLTVNKLCPYWKLNSSANYEESLTLISYFYTFLRSKLKLFFKRFNVKYCGQCFVSWSPGFSAMQNTDNGFAKATKNARDLIVICLGRSELW